MKHVHLISTPRSGSTYFIRTIQEYYSPQSLVNVKNVHEDYNEPFAELSFESENTIKSRYDTILTRLHDSEYPLAIKSHYVHLTSVKKHNYMHKLNEIDFYNIGLIRKNVWETSLSLCIANIKNEWFGYEDYNTITIDEIYYTQWLINCLAALTEFKNNQCDIKFNEIIFYEDFSFDPRTDYTKLKLYTQSRKFLDNRKLPSTFQPAPSKRDIVENYDRIRQVFKETLFELMKTRKDFSWIKLDPHLNIKTESFL